MIRVSSLAMHTMSLANLQLVQSRMAEQSIAISTGKVAQRYSGVGLDAGRLVNLESLQQELDQFVKNNNLVDNRLQAMESATSGMFDIATEIRIQLVQALNAGNAEVMPLNQIAQSLLEQVASLLNTEYNGRRLFGGSVTNVAPVDLNAAGFNPPPAIPSAADTLYYQGDTTKLSTRADDNLTVTYGVTADEAGFEQLIRTLHIAANVTTSPVPNLNMINEALRVAEQAIENLPTILGKIGASRATLEGANSSHGERLLYTQETIGDIENVDITKAITLISADQITLEASFATLAQISRVSLLDFL